MTRLSGSAWPAPTSTLGRLRAPSSSTRRRYGSSPTTRRPTVGSAGRWRGRDDVTKPSLPTGRDSKWRRGPAIFRRRRRSRSSSVDWNRSTADRGERAADLAAAGSRRTRGASGHEHAAERGGLLAVLLERRLKPSERPVALRQADAIDRQVVHETGIEHMLSVTAGAHAGRRLLGHAQERAEGLDVLRQYGFVTEIHRHFGETSQEVAYRHRRSRRPGAFLEISR